MRRLLAQPPNHSLVGFDLEHGLSQSCDHSNCQMRISREVTYEPRPDRILVSGLFQQLGRPGIDQHLFAIVIQCMNDRQPRFVKCMFEPQHFAKIIPGIIFRHKVPSRVQRVHQEFISNRKPPFRWGARGLGHERNERITRAFEFPCPFVSLPLSHLIPRPCGEGGLMRVNRFHERRGIKSFRPVQITPVLKRTDRGIAGFNWVRS